MAGRVGDNINIVVIDDFGSIRVTSNTSVSCIEMISNERVAMTS